MHVKRSTLSFTRAYCSVRRLQVICVLCVCVCCLFNVRIGCRLKSDFGVGMSSRLCHVGDFWELLDLSKSPSPDFYSRMIIVATVSCCSKHKWDNPYQVLNTVPGTCQEFFNIFPKINILWWDHAVKKGLEGEEGDGGGGESSPRRCCLRTQATAGLVWWGSHSTVLGPTRAGTRSSA